MALLLGKELGTEAIAREALVLLVDNLNAAIATEDAKWATLDSELAVKLNQDYVPCISNKVNPENFYMGHRPSLIEAEPERYPNVCTMSYATSPSTDQGDHYEGNMISLYIEAMVIDGPYDQTPVGFERNAEDLINRKAQRMAEAVHNVIVSNSTLNGIVFEIPNPPRLIVSDTMRRRAKSGQGSDYYWQMIHLEYFIPKVSTY